VSTPREDLLRLAYGYRASQCLYAGGVLGLFDRLAVRALTAEELARDIGADSDAVARLVRALVELGLIERDAHGRCALTPTSRLLVAGSEGSERAELMHALHPTSWLPWGNLANAVQSGAAAFPDLFGKSAWDHRRADPESAAVFHAMAEGRSRRDVEFVLDNLEPRGARSIVDAGGGTGRMMVSLLARWPDVSGVILERTEVAADAARLIDDAGLSNRCTVEAGNFFREIPRGDLVLLKAILRNHDDKHAFTILRNARRALAPGGRAVIIEALAEEPSANGWQDLHMLVMHGGRERTREEYLRLLKAAGLPMTTMRVEDGRMLIEARPRHDSVAGRGHGEGMSQP